MKPANIMLDGSRIRITDFGLAGSTGEITVRHTRLHGARTARRRRVTPRSASIRSTRPLRALHGRRAIEGRSELIAKREQTASRSHRSWCAI
jgi:serine/threonine protein kinase